MSTESRGPGIARQSDQGTMDPRWDRPTGRGRSQAEPTGGRRSSVASGEARRPASIGPTKPRSDLPLIIAAVVLSVLLGFGALVVADRLFPSTGPAQAGSEPTSSTTEPSDGRSSEVVPSGALSSPALPGAATVRIQQGRGAGAAGPGATFTVGLEGVEDRPSGRLDANGNAQVSVPAGARVVEVCLVPPDQPDSRASCQPSDADNLFVVTPPAS